MLARAGAPTSGSPMPRTSAIALEEFLAGARVAGSAGCRFRGGGDATFVLDAVARPRRASAARRPRDGGLPGPNRGRPAVRGVGSGRRGAAGRLRRPPPAGRRGPRSKLSARPTGTSGAGRPRGPSRSASRAPADPGPGRRADRCAEDAAASGRHLPRRRRCLGRSDGAARPSSPQAEPTVRGGPTPVAGSRSRADPAARGLPTAAPARKAEPTPAPARRSEPNPPATGRPVPDRECIQAAPNRAGRPTWRPGIAAERRPDRHGRRGRLGQARHGHLGGLPGVRHGRPRGHQEVPASSRPATPRAVPVESDDRHPDPLCRRFERI